MRLTPRKVAPALRGRAAKLYREWATVLADAGTLDADNAEHLPRLAVIVAEFERLARRPDFASGVLMLELAGAALPLFDALGMTPAARARRGRRARP